VYKVTIKQSFSAAHALKEVAGMCEKLHGHNFAVEVSLFSHTLNDAGIVIDFNVLKEWTNEILKEFDHTCLNELSYFNDLNPSAENIAKFIHDRIMERAKGQNIDAVCVNIWESENTGASYSKCQDPFPEASKLI
jgi:6-pyruvoyltetrahydropterin/6-carboxytetrahydropterin synthase